MSTEGSDLLDRPSGTGNPVSNEDLLTALDRVSARLDRVEADLERLGGALPAGADGAQTILRATVDAEDEDDIVPARLPARHRAVAPWLALALALGLFGGGAWWVFSQPGGGDPPPALDAGAGRAASEMPVVDPPEPAAPAAVPAPETPQPTSPTPDRVAVADGPVAGAPVEPPAALEPVAEDPAVGFDPDLAALPDDAPDAQREQAARALAGDGVAQHDLATWFAVEAVPPDLRRAAYWYEQASDSGITNATYNLGVLLQQGGTIPQDLERAFALFQRAANENHSHAQNALGLAYLAGRGVAPDPVRAATWFSTAYANGNPRGAYYLGRIFEMGVDGAPDLASALAWYRVAAQAGDPQAGEALDRLGPADAAPILADGGDAVFAGDGGPPIPGPAPADTTEPEAEAEQTVADPAAADPVDEAEPPELSREEIRTIQRILAELDYDPGPADGLMGARTEAAITAFQTDRDLPVTGTPTPVLLEILRRTQP